jgi:energy-coupling factor transporter ATP-binding protein EcfA2
MDKANIESKRDVLEFLWEWAEEKGKWAKLLLHEILNTSEVLSTSKLDIIYKQFRKSIGLPGDIEEVEIQKPNNTFSGKSIQLKKLHKITGLNRLSPDSVIEFSPNLTVIYGENGTGKSGFSRILKDIGYSYELETKLIPNIYSEDSQDISAEIDYECDGISNIFTWKPGIKKEELKDISVYNSSCVAISLLKNRNLIVTPLGFSYFDRVSYELGKLSSLLTNEKKSLETTFDLSELFHEGTVYYETIQKLQSLTQQDTEKLPVFTSDDQKQLSELEMVYANTTKELIEKDINDLKTQSSELMITKQEIERAKLKFAEIQWNDLLQTSKELKRLKEKGYGSLEELAKEKGFELYGKAEFESFIKAADVYINTFPDNDNYPDSREARCIYCNQVLHDTASIELLKKYKTILNDTTRQDLEKQENKFSNLIDMLKNIPNNIQLHYPSYGQDEQQKIIQPEYLKTYNNSVENLKKSVEVDDFENILFGIDYDVVINSLQLRINEINQQNIEKNNTLADIESKKLKLINEINILKDKQIFTSKKDDIINIIKNYALKNVLEKNENAFDTASISTKTSKARRELIEQSFSDTFSEELNKLRKGHIEIELNFETKKGETNIHQCLQERYILSDILSEGEQKAISLAEFFTELSLDGGNATVVFDDPVNSLDHHLIDETAKRLIACSKKRQTVVFTHSILLFNSLLYQIKLPYNKSLQNHFYHSKNQYDICGVITDADEEINNPKSCIKNLNTLINNNPKNRPEEEVASEGYGYLRTAIELTVEHEILNGTVKRYQKNIALTNFSKISGSDIDKYKESLNDIFEKCCGSISGHSNPEEVAYEGYSYLRSAIELTVEHEILQGTVKRYQKNVALTNFSKLSGTDIDNCKVILNDLFEKCCGSISAHSNPIEVVNTPNMNQLKADFQTYQEIRKVFLP